MRDQKAAGRALNRVCPFYFFIAHFIRGTGFRETAISIFITQRIKTGSACQYVPERSIPETI